MAESSLGRLDRKRLRTYESQRDKNFLKRLRIAGQRTRMYSTVIIRLGPAAEEYEMLLFPLITHSLYFRRRIESTFDDTEDGNGSHVVINLPDFLCDPDIFRMVQDFCYGVMEEKNISTSNVLKLFNVGEFLGIKRLARKAWKFLQNNVFNCMWSCFEVLATFDCKDLSKFDVDVEDTQIQNCTCEDCSDTGATLGNEDQPEKLDQSRYPPGYDTFLMDHSLLSDDSEDETWPKRDPGIQHMEDTQPSGDAGEAQVERCEDNMLFRLCRNGFLTDVLHKTVCKWPPTINDVDWLLRIAESLPLITAELMYKSCGAKEVGLFMSYSVPEEDADSCLAIISHVRVDPKEKCPGTAYSFFNTIYDINPEVDWIEALHERLPDLSRRSLLILHLSKMMRLASDVTSPTRSICSSELSWGFLCALLVEATELSTMTEKHTVAVGLDEEVVFLQGLVSEGLGQVSILKPSDLSQQEGPILMLLMKFKFSTLLAIVDKFKRFVSDHNVGGAANLLESCIREHLKASSFTEYQALMIYELFPNGARASHVELSQALRMKAMSAKQVLQLTKLLDFNTLPDDIVEKLFEDLEVGFEPPFAKRYTEIQREKKIKKEKSDQELIHLQSELQIRTADLMQAREDHRLAERKLEEELKRVVELQQASNERNVHLRSELGVRTQELLDVTDAKRSVEKERDELSESKVFITHERDVLKEVKRLLETELLNRKRSVEIQRGSLSEGKTFTKKEKSALEKRIKLIEGQRDAMQHDLEEAKEKTTCQICYDKPRDALSLPCMHFHYCSECLNLHHRRSKTCPTCQGFTSGVLKCTLDI